MSKAGSRIIKAAEEALAFAKGDAPKDYVIPAQKPVRVPSPVQIGPARSGNQSVQVGQARFEWGEGQDEGRRPCRIERWTKALRPEASQPPHPTLSPSGRGFSRAAEVLKVIAHEPETVKQALRGG